MKLDVRVFVLAMLAFFGVAHAGTFTMDGPCQSYHSPNGGGEAAIIKLIGSAKHSVHLLAYSFTSKPIATALVDAQKRGVQVEVVLDKSQPTANGSQMAFVQQASIPVWVDEKHAIAHNKVIIIDERILETGSFNFTYSAEHSNGENVLICPTVSGAAVYLDNFKAHKAHSVQ